jgi:hypothetical protein
LGAVLDMLASLLADAVTSLAQRVGRRLAAIAGCRCQARPDGR